MRRRGVGRWAIGVAACVAGIVAPVVAHAASAAWGDPLPGAPARAVVPTHDAPAGTGAMAAPPVIGTSRWATLLCRYADDPSEPVPRAYHVAQFDGAVGSLRHYWESQSRGLLSLAGSVALGWSSLPRARGAYCTASTCDLDRLFDDCLAATTAAAPGFDRDAFDGVNIVVNGELDGRFWGGGHCAPARGGTHCWRATWSVARPWYGVAALAHEMGHAFGLPHANNGDGDASPYDNPWDVMSDAWGHATSDATYGLVPKPLGAGSRERLGWLLPDRTRVIDRDGIYADLALAATAGDVIVVETGAASGVTRYLVEARRGTRPYDGRLPGDGVVIHAIDDARAEPAWLVDAALPAADYADAGTERFTPGESWTSPDGRIDVAVGAGMPGAYRVTIARGDRRVFADAFE